MNTIADYVSQKDQIEALNKQVFLLKQLNSKWKRKLEKLKGQPTRRETRTLKAELFVSNWIGGDTSLNFRQIAELCHLSRETIKNISYKLRHKTC